MKSYSFYALLLFIAGWVGIGLTLKYTNPDGWIGGIAISVSTTWAIAAALFTKRNFDTKQIKFINRSKNNGV